jgi:hypothetical protein
MRNLTIGIFVVALGCAACDRQPQPAVNDSQTASPNGAAAAAAAHLTNAEAPASPTLATTAGTAGGATAASDVKTEASAATEAPRQNEWREVTIPAGTSLPVVLDTEVASDTTATESPVSAHLSRAISVGGGVAVPQGSAVRGVVTEATRAAKVKGLARIAMRFDTLTRHGDDERYHIQTGTVARTAAPTKKNDTVKILGPAVGGAIIGRIAGGRKGAAIGAGAGAGAGAAAVMATRGKEVRLGQGAPLTLRLTAPLTVRIRG